MRGMVPDEVPVGQLGIFGVVFAEGVEGSWDGLAGPLQQGPDDPADIETAFEMRSQGWGNSHHFLIGRHS